MLKRGGKFRPKVGPRGPPRPALKPASSGVDKDTPTPDSTQNESASHPAGPPVSSTSTPIATSPSTEILSQPAEREENASPARDPGATGPVPTHRLGEQRSHHASAAPESPPTTTTRPRAGAPAQEASAPAPTSNTSAPAPAHDASTEASVEPPESTTPALTRPQRKRATRAAQTSRSTRAASDRNRQGSSPAPAQPDREDREPSPPLTIQEAIAINTANQSGNRRGRRKGTGTSRTQRASGPRKRKSRADGGEEGNDAEAGPKRRRAPRRQADGEEEPQTRGQRALTPENAEEQVVDPTSLTLGDVTRDLRIGRKFSKHDELLQREKDKKQKQREEKRAKKLAAIMGQPPPGADKPDGGSEEQQHNPENDAGSNDDNNRAIREQQRVESPAQPVERGPRLEIVNGQLVIDQSSLQIDIHANTMNQDLPEVVEDDFTHLTTSASHLPPGKRLKNPWTDEETALFYTSLRMFGTDFLTISKMFPHKNRRQVKLKFNREERANPEAVNRALVGVKDTKIDIDMFKLHSRRELRSVEEIEADHRAEMEELQRKEDERREELEEENRRKREELERNIEEERNRKGKRKRKNAGAAQGAGDGAGGAGAGGAGGAGGGEIVEGPANGPVSHEEAFGRGSGRVQAERPAFGSQQRF